MSTLPNTPLKRSKPRARLEIFQGCFGGYTLEVPGYLPEYRRSEEHVMRRKEQGQQIKYCRYRLVRSRYEMGYDSCIGFPFILASVGFLLSGNIHGGSTFNKAHAKKHTRCQTKAIITNNTIPRYTISIVVAEC